MKTNSLTFFQAWVCTLWAKRGHFLYSFFDVIDNLLLVGEPNNDSCDSEVIKITVGIDVAKYSKYSCKQCSLKMLHISLWGNVILHGAETVFK